MHGHLRVLVALGFASASLLGFPQASIAKESPVIAIDIALEPDAKMIQYAVAANNRLLKAFPKGFALDETHRPHVTILQQFVADGRPRQGLCGGGCGLRQGEGGQLDAEGDQILLHPVSAGRTGGHRGRADRRLAQAAKRTHCRGRAIHGDDRNPCSLRQR